MKKIVLTLLALTAALTSLTAAPSSKKAWKSVLRCDNPAFFTTDSARIIGDQILAWQRVTGGWPKNIDMVTFMTPEQLDKVRAERDRRDDSTTDNDATTIQLTYLARLYGATGDARYRDAFRRGVQYLLDGQYPGGGWPQFWPVMRDYQIHITYNDDAMVNTMRLLRDIADGTPPYAKGIVDKKMVKEMRRAFDRGVDCIVATQIVAGGEPTVWCQQHDRETLAPAPARAYELPSYSSQESAAIVKLLMEIPKPSPAVKRSIHAAMRWFDRYKITGYRLVRSGRHGTPQSDIALVADPAAPAMWARFYDLERCEPYVCDRDGVPRRHLDQIGRERRTGYSWYNDRAAELFPLYDEWCRRNDPEGRVSVSLDTPGGNETGLMDLWRRPDINPADFDAVVLPGQSIQEAIAAAPAAPAEPYKIFVAKGTYNEKVIIDRPNIMLVGEHRDSTVITWAERRDQFVPYPHTNGINADHGTLTLQAGADDCIISGLTIVNNYGSTVEPTTTHQMAVYGRATRTIIINSNIRSDGNDALSLWCQQGGMYYHADLDITCPGVDFMCPRGRCYATRCRLTGDGRALIWHDGRGDMDNKLVITESTFDNRTPGPLGRYHHDSQFYLICCNLTERVADRDINYAYTDKVLDPCPWGRRVYYYGCQREGGHSGWLADNLAAAPGSPAFHAVTARWTFDDQWDPQATIRSLWHWLAY